MAQQLSINDPAIRRQQELFLDGMEVSADMGLIAYERLRASLEAYSVRMANGGAWERDTTVTILLEAWSTVDSVNRLRTLVQRTPFLKKKSPPVVSFLKDTRDIETVRHFVQHMSEKTTQLALTGHPIWGSLSWAYVTSEQQQRGGLACLLLIPGRLAKSMGHPIVNPIGHRISVPVGMISLTACGATVNLSQAHEAVARFRTRLDAAVTQATKKREEDGDLEGPLVLRLGI